jgi:choice-of-anchor C domain-containing protein
MVMALALLCGAGQAQANLIGNGGFEVPVTPSGGFTTLVAPDPVSMAPWNLTGGSVDVVNNGYWPAFQGLNSLDLNGFTPGTISQTFGTNAGQAYNLSFWYANNADNPGLNPTADVTVTGLGTLLSTSISHTGSSRANMNYTLFTGTFTADSSSATLQFAATIGGAQGIVLDAVSVTATPEPATLTLLGVGAVGLVGLRYRRRQA